MNALISKLDDVLCLYMVLFHSFHLVHANRTYFQLIAGADIQSSAADSAPHIRKEFYHCGREESCTHVMRLSNGYTLIHGSDELKTQQHEAVCIYKKMWLPGKIILHLAGLILCAFDWFTD